MPNRLAAETSPYLRQHAGNPVDWYPWGDEAFAAAREGDRPILLSIGYSACHWCHVMAHESFEDPETAALMNRLFVNVKVDREERPDVDTVYMQAIQGMTGQGGWPLTAFLTPGGVPFFGGTYFPPQDRHGLPAFSRVLSAAADAFQQRRAEIEAAGERLRAALQPPRLRGSDVLDEDVLNRAARSLVEHTDRRHGGFGAAPKFPHPMAIDLLLHRHASGGDGTLLSAAEVTLDAMARGGVFDQVGGGFHRYSVDAGWAVPHFEKMLYDNAQLAPVYLHAHQLTGSATYREVCTRTLDYMARELLLPAAGFAASQDADSPGGEGAYFVWTPAQLREALGDADSGLAARLYGVVEGGNFEHGTTVLSLPYPVERLAAALGGDLESLQVRVDGIRERLLSARAARAAPARDEKVLTAWNALAVSAFAEAGAVLQHEPYERIARQVATFLLDAVVVDGVVMRSWMAGQARIVGFLEDTAHLAAAMLTVYESSGEPRFFEAALMLAEQVLERFRDPDGSYRDTAAEGDTLIVRPRTLEDNPITAGQSVAAAVFARLHAFTGEQRWDAYAREIVGPLAEAVARAPLALSGLGLALELVLGPVHQVAISGDVHDPATSALLHAVWSRFVPRRVLAWGPADGVPLLAGRGLLEDRPAAYVCHGFSCDRPVTTPQELLPLLS